MTGGGFAILMYHELERLGTPMRLLDPGYVRYVVTEQRFSGQLERLRQLGFAGVSLGDALIPLRDQGHVAITFDDGCESDLTIAAPILLDAGMGATFFVSASLIGAPGYLSRKQLASLSALGFQIGCHGATHRFLTEVSDAELVDETAGAKSVLEDMIGNEVDHFSCPGGRWDDRVVKAIMDAGYRTVSTSVPGKSLPGERIQRRNAVLRHTRMAEFERLCQGRRSIVARLGDATLTGAKRVLGTSVYEHARSLLLRAR